MLTAFTASNSYGGRSGTVEYANGKVSALKTITGDYSYTTTYTYDGESRVTGYSKKYPFEFYGTGSDGFDFDVSMFISNYSRGMTGVLLPCEARITSLNYY